VLLSNGEKALDDHFKEKGIFVKAGQSVRFLEFPVTGAYGSFDNLHTMDRGRLFADTVKANAKKYYGTAGIAFLESLVVSNQDFSVLHETALALFIKEGMSSQEHRAVTAFALVGLAGELATEYGITGWQVGDAMQASLACFESWREFRGKGQTEDSKILEMVKSYIDRYGDVRFTPTTFNNESSFTYTTDDGVVHEQTSSTNHYKDTVNFMRSGWFRDVEGNREWLFTSTGLCDATVGYNKNRVIKALKDAGWLKLGDQNKSSTPERINGEVKRLYVVNLK